MTNDNKSIASGGRRRRRWRLNNSSLNLHRRKRIQSTLLARHGTTSSRRNFFFLLIHNLFALKRLRRPTKRWFSRSKVQASAECVEAKRFGGRKSMEHQSALSSSCFLSRLMEISENFSLSVSSGLFSTATRLAAIKAKAMITKCVTTTTESYNRLIVFWASVSYTARASHWPSHFLFSDYVGGIKFIIMLEMVFWWLRFKCVRSTAETVILFLNFFKGLRASVTLATFFVACITWRTQKLFRFAWITCFYTWWNTLLAFAPATWRHRQTSLPGANFAD